MSELKRIERSEMEEILAAAERRSEAMKSGLVTVDFHCLVCRDLISEKRATRGAVTCGPDCSKVRQKRMRDWRASKTCRLCGRRARTPRPERVLTEAGSIEYKPCAEPAQVGA